MPVLDTTEFDFSAEHALGADKVARRVAVVKNDSDFLKRVIMKRRR